VSDKLYAFTADPNKPLREAREEIARLRAERDDARRQVCAWCGLLRNESSQVVATENNWDCFKEDSR
jgi:hypothetical protein